MQRRKPSHPNPFESGASSHKTHDSGALGEFQLDVVSICFKRSFLNDLSFRLPTGFKCGGQSASEKALSCQPHRSGLTIIISHDSFLFLYNVA